MQGSSQLINRATMPHAAGASAIELKAMIGPFNEGYCGRGRIWLRTYCRPHLSCGPAYHQMTLVSGLLRCRGDKPRAPGLTGRVVAEIGIHKHFLDMATPAILVGAAQFARRNGRSDATGLRRAKC